MAGEAEAKWPVDGVLDADARAGMQLGVWLGNWESVVNDLQRRALAGEVEPIVLCTRKAEGLAKTRRTRGEQAGLTIRRKTAVARHRVKASHWFERAEEDSTGHAIGLTGDVEAVVLAVDGVNVRVTRRTEENDVARRGTAISVGCGIRWIVVRTEVGFNLDDAAGKDFAPDAMDEEFAEQARRYELGRVFVETARERSQLIPPVQQSALHGWDALFCAWHG